MGGLLAIMETFHVGRLRIGREVSSPSLVRLEELARERRIPIEHELRGKSFRWDGVEGDFLWPEVAAEEIAPSAKNNDSLVLRLRYGRRSILLPGDAGKEVEREIVSENIPQKVHADVLKIGHHGSKNSTIPEFLAEVQPVAGIISELALKRSAPHLPCRGWRNQSRSSTTRRNRKPAAACHS